MTESRISRRSLLTGTGAGLASFALAPWFSGQQVLKVTDALGVTDPLAGWSLYKDVLAYDLFGEHHTATVSSLASADWLEQHLIDQGFETERHPFLARQSFVKKVVLRTGAFGLASVEAYPLWPATFPVGTISQPLVAFPSPNLNAVSGKIAVATFPFNFTGQISQTIIDLIESAAAAGAVAMVAISEGPSGHITVMNPIDDRAAWPIPVVLVGPQHTPQLLGALKSGAKTTLQLEGQNVPDAPSVNVIGRHIQDENAPWIVISTPYSGWFRCSGERGPGISIWRGLCRWVAARRRLPLTVQPPLNYLFVATSGHELGGLGMDAFLRDLAPTPESVKLWLHLGAWVASYAWQPATGKTPAFRLNTSNTRFLVTLDYSDAVLADLLKLPGLYLLRYPIGEAQQIHDAGYGNLLAITGRNVPHHTRLDVPANTSPGLLAPVARALSQFILQREAEISP